MDKFPWKKIVFLADVYEPAASNLSPHLRRDLEKTDQSDVDEIMTALREICADVRHFRSTDSLIEAKNDLQNTILFSTYSGPPTRNRLIHAPALAEILGIDYVGLDAMGQALAHDKAVMKRLAAECGLKTPAWRILREPAETLLCAEFPAPYVLKPVAEGSSIGISQSNLIRQSANGAPLALELMQRFDQPVLMEAFVGGLEVSFVSVETAEDPYTAFVHVAVDGQPCYFDDHLFDADEKLDRKLDRSIMLIDEQLIEEDRLAILRLLRDVGHYGYIRVDGKLSDGHFSFLELTPDAWLAERGQVAGGFLQKGWTYTDVLRAILMSAMTGPRGQYASG